MLDPETEYTGGWSSGGAMECCDGVGADDGGNLLSCVDSYNAKMPKQTQSIFQKSSLYKGSISNTGVDCLKSNSSKTHPFEG